MTELRQASMGAGDLITDAWGVQKVSLPFSLFHGMWTFDIPPTMWFMYENGIQVYSSTDIISVEGHARLRTTATNTSLLLESRQCPRYQPNRGHLFSTAGWLPAKTADGIREFGVVTVDNGVFFRLKADGLLYAVLRKRGIDTEYSIANADLPATFDPEKNNIYDIQFQWRGAGNYKFYIGDPETGTSKLVRTIKILGTLTGLSINNPALPIAFKATRITEDVEMHLGCADITSESGKSDKDQYVVAAALAVTTSTDTPVITIKQPLLIGGETNTRTVNFARVKFTCDKKATFTLWKTRDPAAFTGGTLVVHGDGSFVELDSPDDVAGAVRVTSVNTALLERVGVASVTAGGLETIDSPDLSKLDIPLVRGDYLVLTCTSSGAGAADAVLEWGEEV